MKHQFYREVTPNGVTVKHQFYREVTPNGVTVKHQFYREVTPNDLTHGVDRSIQRSLLWSYSLSGSRSKASIMYSKYSSAKNTRKISCTRLISFRAPYG